MDQAARLMLIAGALLAAGVLSSKVSSRSGVPLALLFVAVGLFAGEEGPLGLPFDDAVLASGIGVTLLALILFDGGLGTPLDHIRSVAAPSIVLATIGVVLTAGLVGVSAVVLLDFSWLNGLLLGSIVGSTDAAAVFAVFRGRGVAMQSRLRSIIEVESGLNDPFAIFLTLAFTALLASSAEAPSVLAIGGELAWQMGIGIGIGAGVGWAASRLLRAVHLDIAGLYLVLSMASALIAFGFTQVAGGSGAIAVYVAGMVIGHSKVPFERGIRRFHDGLAWISQVGVFAMLGLLATPSELIAQASEGIAIAVALVVVARPVTVALLTVPFGLDWRDQLVVACGGLKGAVPVILATIPLAAGIPESGRIFNIVFFAVLLSVLLQGTALAPLTRWLGREEHVPAEPPVSLELTALRETGQELLGYRVDKDSRAVGQAIRDLPLPLDALITLIVRGSEVIAPRGSTVLQPDDQVYVLHSAGAGMLVSTLFAASPPDDATLTDAAQMPFALDASLSTVEDIANFYGVVLPGRPTKVLAEWLEQRLGRRAVPGDRVTHGGLTLLVLSARRGQPHLIAVELNDTTEMPAAQGEG